jgi:electron transport complex protein RnfC
MDVNVVVQNVGTAALVADAVVHGRPLTERVVTVTGSAIRKPANLSIRIGTLMGQAITACGGVQGELGKLIAGGPMMGLAQYTDLVPVTKGTSGILLLAKDEVTTAEPGPCIRCGRCSRACPMRLVPTDIAICSDKGLIEKAEEVDALDCIECGSCSFDCPAGIPLVQKIRLAKASITAAKQRIG